MSTTSAKRQQIISALRDKGYRDLSRFAHVTNGLAFQIRATREALGLSQRELGERAGMAQERISLLENPDYGRFTLSTLDKLASAFDVALIVKFAPYSELVDWITDISPEDLAVPSFENDQKLRNPDAQPSISGTAELVDEVHSGWAPDNIVQFSGYSTRPNGYTRANTCAEYTEMLARTDRTELLAGAMTRE